MLPLILAAALSQPCPGGYCPSAQPYYPPVVYVLPVAPPLYPHTSSTVTPVPWAAPPLPLPAYTTIYLHHRTPYTPVVPWVPACPGGVCPR